MAQLSRQFPAPNSSCGEISCPKETIGIPIENYVLLTITLITNSRQRAWLARRKQCERDGCFCFARGTVSASLQYQFSAKPKLADVFS
jgi:hypothetical protein